MVGIAAAAAAMSRSRRGDNADDGEEIQEEEEVEEESREGLGEEDENSEDVDYTNDNNFSYGGGSQQQPAAHGNEAYLAAIMTNLNAMRQDMNTMVASNKSADARLRHLENTNTYILRSLRSVQACVGVPLAPPPPTPPFGFL